MTDAASDIVASVDGTSSSIGYYSNVRSEILELIPTAARRLLDVGCGFGAMGAEAKRRGVVSVYGIEINEHAAQQARKVLDDVVVGNVEHLEIPWAGFDCIVCADVLEHLANPWQALRRLRDHLAPSGMVIASVPNVAQHHVVRQLVAGRFDYVNSGILDRTHLRFFTKSTIEKMFSDCGYGVASVNELRGETWKDKLLRVASLGRLSHLTVGQYLVIAVPHPTR